MPQSELLNDIHKLLELANVSQEDYFLKTRFLLDNISPPISEFLNKSGVKLKSTQIKKVQKIYKKCDELLKLVSDQQVMFELEQASITKEYLDNIDYKKQTVEYEDENNAFVAIRGKFHSMSIICSLLELKYASCWYENEYSDTETRGRPSLDNYYDFVLYNARIYQTLCNDKFTFMRHKNANDAFEAVTDGHRFIVIVTDILNRSISRVKKANIPLITEKNICTACEKAVSNLNKIRDEKRPQSYDTYNFYTSLVSNTKSDKNI